MQFSDLIKKTTDISNKFPQKYDERDHLIDLVEEVGELAQAMQIATGRKHTNDPQKQKTIEDVTDAISDVLFELIRLAVKLNIDLETEYLKVLDHIDQRLAAGEFDINQ